MALPETLASHLEKNFKGCVMKEISKGETLKQSRRRFPLSK